MQLSLEAQKLEQQKHLLIMFQALGLNPTRPWDWLTPWESYT